MNHSSCETQQGSKNRTKLFFSDSEFIWRFNFMKNNTILFIVIYYFLNNKSISKYIKEIYIA